MSIMKTNHLRTLVRAIICETLQQLNEAENGEWWIYPGGDAQFADGDVGDSGHEGYVIEHVAREIYEHFIGYEPGDQMGYLSQYEDYLFKSLQSEGRLTEQDIETWERGRGPTEVLIAKLLEDKVYNSPNQAQDAVYIAYGSSSKDARDYAMKYLGWKRMTTSRNYGTDIQTWFLRDSDLKDIKRGIYDAWAGDDEDEDEASHEVTIEVRANNKTFSGIPLSELETATVSDLATYQRGAAWMRERKVAPVMDPVNFTPMG
jgi:hypothetical protein